MKNLLKSYAYLRDEQGLNYFILSFCFSISYFFLISFFGYNISDFFLETCPMSLSQAEQTSNTVNDLSIVLKTILRSQST